MTERPSKVLTREKLKLCFVAREGKTLCLGVFKNARSISQLINGCHKYMMNNLAMHIASGHLDMTAPILTLASNLADRVNKAFSYPHYILIVLSQPLCSSIASIYLYLT